MANLQLAVKSEYFDAMIRGERKRKSIACVMTTGISELCSGNMTA